MLYTASRYTQPTELLYAASPIFRLQKVRILRMPTPNLQNSQKVCLLHSGCRTPVNSLSVTQLTELLYAASPIFRLQKVRILRMPTPKLQNSHKVCLLHSGCRTPVNCLSVQPAYRTPVSCVSYTQAAENPYTA